MLLHLETSGLDNQSYFPWEVSGESKFLVMKVSRGVGL